jgi:hypothetical protein
MFIYRLRHVWNDVLSCMKSRQSHPRLHSYPTLDVIAYLWSTIDCDMAILRPSVQHYLFTSDENIVWKKVLHLWPFVKEVRKVFTIFWACYLAIVLCTFIVLWKILIASFSKSTGSLHQKTSLFLVPLKLFLIYAAWFQRDWVLTSVYRNISIFWYVTACSQLKSLPMFQKNVLLPSSE